MVNNHISISIDRDLLNSQQNKTIFAAFHAGTESISQCPPLALVGREALGGGGGEMRGWPPSSLVVPLHLVLPLSTD